MHVRAALTALALMIVAGVALAACGGPTPTGERPSVSSAASASGAPDASPAGTTPIIIDTDLDVSDVGAMIALLLDPLVDVGRSPSPMPAPA